MLRRHAYGLIALLAFAVFVAVTIATPQPYSARNNLPATDRVVIAAPILVGLFAGDRYLAANLEAIRLAATSVDNGQADSGYLIRAQNVVAELNPCHEDNYYLANGLLTWGGAVAEGNKVLEAAMACRTWDFTPAFFLGVNKSFFDHDVPAAQQALETAAERSPQNAAPLRKLSVMLKAEQFADERLALDYLIEQRDSTQDPALRAMLEKRVVRLQGLLALREAQREYQAKYGPLTNLQQLLERGLLQEIPLDPLRLGYELHDGRIIMKKLKIAGMEEQP